MNSVQRFFRRYILSMIGIIFLFLGINIALFFAVMIIGSMSGSGTSLSVRDLSDGVVWQDGAWTADSAALSILRKNDAWAMLLDENGNVVWQQDLPEDLPRSYTSADIASFSRWYLDSYPVKIRAREDGSLMVAGLQPRTLVKFYYSLEWPYIEVMAGGIAAVFLCNLFLIIFLILRNTRKVEKAMTPILQGIQDLSRGKPRHLEEQGELAEISRGLNRAADYMSRKDNTRAEWIRGVSHDIRTPLSIVLGYASELEENDVLPQEARKQAGIIRLESEKMKRLIDDLNLTTKLEYALQPVQVRNVDLAETGRLAAGEALNSGLPQQYEIAFSEARPGRSLPFSGDSSLLLRMLDNLIRNSVIHNPQGCRIILSAGEEDGYYLYTVSDDGIGLSPALLAALNQGQDISSTRNCGGKSEHGLGLKLVRQIVRAHQGKIQFSDTVPHGLTVKVFLPIKS